MTKHKPLEPREVIILTARTKRQKQSLGEIQHAWRQWHKHGPASFAAILGDIEEREYRRKNPDPDEKERYR